jgi:hypothetical protein
MQPKAIPEKAETAKWKMEDIIKVIKLDLSTINYRRSLCSLGLVRRSSNITANGAVQRDVPQD